MTQIEAKRIIEVWEKCVLCERTEHEIGPLNSVLPGAFSEKQIDGRITMSMCGVCQECLMKYAGQIRPVVLQKIKERQWHVTV